MKKNHVSKVIPSWKNFPWNPWKMFRRNTWRSFWKKLEVVKNIPIVWNISEENHETNLGHIYEGIAQSFFFLKEPPGKFLEEFSKKTLEKNLKSVKHLLKNLLEKF